MDPFQTKLFSSKVMMKDVTARNGHMLCVISVGTKCKRLFLLLLSTSTGGNIASGWMRTLYC